MKLLIATVTLASLIAVPALAQSNGHKARAQQPLRAAAQVNQINQYGRTENGQRHSTNPAHDVYDTGGRYVGSDPDSRIRQDLLNDRAE